MGGVSVVVRLGRCGGCINQLFSHTSSVYRVCREPTTTMLTMVVCCNREGKGRGRGGRSEAGGVCVVSLCQGLMPLKGM